MIVSIFRVAIFCFCLIGITIEGAAQVRGLADLPVQIYPSSYRIAHDSTLFEAALRPFYHGIASGDPLQDRVIIWTRVAPKSPADSSISVIWRVATDTAMQQVVQQGTFITDKQRDYTVKVDIAGLQPATTYYYEFEAHGAYSRRGRTLTAPASNEKDHLRFGVVSCSNYEAGFFNAYARLAERADLDAIIHLGDYIYEYATGIYGDSTTQRKHDTLEAYALEIYRARYGLYRLDQDLQAVHQQHPFITIWDDHETANDAWEGGAQNHTEGDEGIWAQRKAEAKQAYMEWMPIREQANGEIYRAFSFGNLMDLTMVDTRLTARDSQILDINDPALLALDRTLLGTVQKQWLFEQLGQSQATWKVIGNQVMFATFNIGWSSIASPGNNFDDIEGTFMDIWDGYPVERQEILDFVDSAQIDDIVMLSGDFHSSFAYDVPDTPNIAGPTDRYKAVDNYDKDSGAGSRLVEFVTPSISSANFDEYIGPLNAAIVEGQMNSPLVIPPFRTPNPHLKYVDLDRHGYTLLHVTQDSVQAEWYYMNTVSAPDTAENFGAAMKVLTGENHLREAETPIPADRNAPTLAPLAIRPIAPSLIDQPPTLLVHHIFPNPANDWILIQYALSKPSSLKVHILDLQGRTIAESQTTTQAMGMYDMRLNVSELVPGYYTLVMETMSDRWVEPLRVMR